MSSLYFDRTLKLTAASYWFFADAAAMHVAGAVPSSVAVDTPAADAISSAVDTPAADAVESAAAAAEGSCR
jgi:hypothetical protein